MEDALEHPTAWKRDVSIRWGEVGGDLVISPNFQILQIEAEHSILDLLKGKYLDNKKNQSPSH